MCLLSLVPLFPSYPPPFTKSIRYTLCGPEIHANLTVLCGSSLGTCSCCSKIAILSFSWPWPPWACDQVGCMPFLALPPLAFPNTKYPANFPLTFLPSPSCRPFPSAEISLPETLASFLGVSKLYLESHGDLMAHSPKASRADSKSLWGHRFWSPFPLLRPDTQSSNFLNLFCNVGAIQKGLKTNAMIICTLYPAYAVKHYRQGEAFHLQLVVNY